MTTEREIFNISGPLYLTDTIVNWNNFDHRRSVAASLVQGVYNLERERQQEPQAQAFPWWDSFHFQLNRLLIAADHSIFGAIYELKSSAFNYSAPKYVIAFRGTLLKPYSMLHDLKLDRNFICNKLHKSDRFKLAMQAVENMVHSPGDHANIWLAGHSLGSAMALLVGKNMAKMGRRIDTYLFNPPFVSAPIEKITNQQVVKHAIRITKSCSKALLAVATKDHHHRQLQDNSFVALSDWVPYLFVNPADHICSGYIGYFENRKKMDEFGLGKVERLATQNSIVSLLGIGNSEPLHLLPSAYLTINLSQSPNFKETHGIRQWWDSNLHNRSVLHQFM